LPFLTPETFFKRGLALTAALDALRAPAATIADARSFEIPCFFAIPAATALNPGCAFFSF